MEGNRVVDFWLDLASTYSYLAAARVSRLAAAERAVVRWRPMLLGSVFRDQGWTTSPFNSQPAKRRHMWRDLERRAALLNIAVREPRVFPRNSLTADRTMLVGLEQGWGERFAMEVFGAEFGNGLDIALPEVLADCVSAAGGDAQHALARAAGNEIKALLREETAAAVAASVFGAPTFVVHGELFWGDDRFDEAMQWCRGQHALQLGRLHPNCHPG